MHAMVGVVGGGCDVLAARVVSPLINSLLHIKPLKEIRQEINKRLERTPVLTNISLSYYVKLILERTGVRSEHFLRFRSFKTTIYTGKALLK